MCCQYAWRHGMNTPFVLLGFGVFTWLLAWTIYWTKSWRYVSIGSDNGLVHSKSLSEPKMAQFTDAYMRFSASMS